MTFLHLYFAGPVHGQRGGVFHPLWAKGRAGPERGRVRFVCAGCGRNRGAERAGLCRHKPYYPLFTGARRGARADAGISGGYLLRHCRHLLYNYFASLLRAVGNSAAPLAFLAVSAVLNIVLDLWFVLGLARGVAGAAEATVISQYVSGVGLAAYSPGCAARACGCSACTAACAWLACARLPGFLFLPACSNR